MAKLGQKYSAAKVLEVLYERFDLATQRATEAKVPGQKRSYWHGEATGLEIAIELLGGTVDGR